MRYSYQRELIKDIVRSSKTHPNAEWVFCEAKKKVENISLGTVYRKSQDFRKYGLKSNQFMMIIKLDMMEILKTIII